MKITITSVSPHRQGVYLGCTISHEKAGWIRFATTVLVLEDLTSAERSIFTHALDRAAYRTREDLDDAEPLF
jgi:hypothetical protein